MQVLAASCLVEQSALLRYDDGLKPSSPKGRVVSREPLEAQTIRDACDHLAAVLPLRKMGDDAQAVIEAFGAVTAALDVLVSSLAEARQDCDDLERIAYEANEAEKRAEAQLAEARARIAELERAVSAIRALNRATEEQGLRDDRSAVVRERDVLRKGIKAAIIGLELATDCHAAIVMDDAESTRVQAKAVASMRLALEHARAALAGVVE